MAILKRGLFAALLFVLASPILLLRAMATGVRKARLLKAASQTRLTCECGGEVSLVGIWRCGCGFTYRGHLLTVCPVCQSLPRMVRCYACGVTTKLPEAA